MSWIQTYTGRKFDFDLPDAELAKQIDIEDIAHALSNICRFTGHCATFYSVAQHSCLVSSLADDRLKLAALLHDASEAYLTDLATPIKQLCKDYVRLEQRIVGVIERRFNLSHDLDGKLKHIDLVALSIERKHLLGTPPESWGYLPAAPAGSVVVPWTSRQSKQVFLRMFKELSNA
jgi:hypothetical protein